VFISIALCHNLDVTIAKHSAEDSYRGRGVHPGEAGAYWN